MQKSGTRGLDISIILAVVNLQRKELVQGLPYLESEISDCKACQQGKQSRLPFNQSTWRATEKLQLIHTDLVGPQ